MKIINFEIILHKKIILFRDKIFTESNVILFCFIYCYKAKLLDG